ncbi:YveK family protein [Enterococcus faecalis]|uniref:Capsular polysaccharide biosynthesis protein CpsC n=1 Tax=Enterococcus faecalis RP2S-4 TaxID=1244145 RepID=A0ABC9TPT4_ENTFL|nr:Wzz/FepE/Etk N-terminal domain-containing protein [Enterococcus faecalis]EPI12593.1 chain length determinant protein [Enterococcus faecalis RP2S-4]
MIFFVIFGSVYGYFNFIKEPVYTSSSQLFLNENSADSTGNNNGLRDTLFLMSTYSSILESPEIMDAAISKNHITMTKQEVLNNLTKKAGTESVIMKLSYDAKSPEDARNFLETLTQLYIQRFPDYFKNISIKIIESPELGKLKSNEREYILAMLVATFFILMNITIQIIRDHTIKSRKQLLDRGVICLGEVIHISKRDLFEWRREGRRTGYGKKKES